MNTLKVKHGYQQLEKAGPLPDSITLKLTGDGAAIAASAMMVFLTFSFPRLADNVLSAAGIRRHYIIHTAYLGIAIHATRL